MNSGKTHVKTSRRQFFGVAAGGLAAGSASTLAAPAIAQTRTVLRSVMNVPKNSPAMGTNILWAAEQIAALSEGRLIIEVYGAGEIVPPLQELDAVISGTVEIGNAAPYFWRGKEPAFQFLGGLPFGLTAQEHNAWLETGGIDVAQKIYDRVGVKFFPNGNTGSQMGGWFKREIQSIDDFRGMNMRVAGIGGEVYKELGANATVLPPSDILPALQSGALDQAEWISPFQDLAFGFHQAAKYYYYPGWQEPSLMQDTFMSMSAWEALPTDLRGIFTAVQRAAHHKVLNEFTAHNGLALKRLVEDHGVNVTAFSDEMLARFAELSVEIVWNSAGSDDLSRELLESMLQFSSEAEIWGQRGELAQRAVSKMAGNYRQ